MARTLEEFASDLNSLKVRTLEENASDLNMAANDVVLAYRELGMAGLEIKIENCYKENTEKLFYCVYQDVASRSIAQIMAISMSLRPDHFFSDENFGSRIGPVLGVAGMDMHSANYCLSIITPVIYKMIDDVTNNLPTDEGGQ